MKKLLLILATLGTTMYMSAHEAQSVYSAALKTAVTQGAKCLTNYMSHTERSKIANFRNYLSYYRSEGGYQTVTPAPAELRDSLSTEERDLFNTLKKYAEPLTQKRPGMPGGSSLTADGNTYYQDMLKLLDFKLKNK